MTVTAKALREKLGELHKEMTDYNDQWSAEGQTWGAEQDERWKAMNTDASDLERRVERAERVEKLGASFGPGSPAVEEAIRASTDDSLDDELAALPGRGVYDGSQGASLEDVDSLTEDLDDDDGRVSNRVQLFGRNAALNEQGLRAWMMVQKGRRPGRKLLAACQRLRLNPMSPVIDVNMGSRPPNDPRLLGMQERARFAAQLAELRGLGRYAAELRAMDTTATTGGELIPEGFVPRWEFSMLHFGGMRQVSEIMRTATGNDLPWPTTDDTGNAGVLLAENGAVLDQDVATAELVLNAYKYTSKFVKVSSELLEDSAFDLASFLGGLLGERIARITNTHFTVGDGTAKPNGIMTAAATGKTTASATAIATDELLDLVHSVDVAYRTLPGVGWMFHDNILLALRKLKDTTNQYLWQPGLAAGEQSQLLGKPYTVNQDMASAITTGLDTAVFGSLRHYKIRDVARFRLVRANERFVDNDQVAWVAFSRHDGDLLDAGTDPVKKLTQL